MHQCTANHAPRLLTTLLVAALVGCGDDQVDPAPVEIVVEEPTPQERLEGVVAAWNSTNSFHFTLQLANRTIALDEQGLLSYTSAAGDVVAPDRMQAQTMVRTPVGNTEVAFISVGDQQWLTNPLTRQWEAAPPGAAGAVSGIFDADTGIGALLIDMDNLEFAGEELLGGTPVHRLRGTLPGSVLAPFAADLATAQRLDIELLAGAEDHRIRQILVREPPAADGTIPTWTFDFTNFDQPVTIEPPL